MVITTSGIKLRPSQLIALLELRKAKDKGMDEFVKASEDIMIAFKEVFDVYDGD